MNEFTDLKDWREYRLAFEGRGTLRRSIGFVPTMGALHAGHASLLERARRENDLVVLSIYVNPTQFNNKDDLQRYPVTLDVDRVIAARSGVDALLLPRFEDIYSDGYRYKVTESDLSLKLCGAHRPGHFDGVLTVVLKLLNLVRPTRAYFGEKDHQQLQLIKGMVEAFFMETEILACPTLREADGLAMSSRNANLPPAARERAPRLNQILRTAVSAGEARRLLEENGFAVDYVEDIDNRRYGAATLSGVRLIDNVEK